MLLQLYDAQGDTQIPSATAFHNLFLYAIFQTWARLQQQTCCFGQRYCASEYFYKNTHKHFTTLLQNAICKSVIQLKSLKQMMYWFPQ